MNSIVIAEKSTQAKNIQAAVGNRYTMLLSGSVSKISMALALVLPLAMIVLIVSVAYAQTPPTPPDTAQSETNRSLVVPSAGPENNTSISIQTTDRKSAPVPLVLMEALEMGKAAKAVARIGNLADEPRLAGKDLSTIQVIGNAIPTRQGTDQGLKVRWSSVLNTATGKRKLIATPLSTDFSSHTFDASTMKVMATGNRDGLVDATLALLEDPSEGATADAGADSETGDSTGSSSSSPTAGGSSSGNEIAGNYKTDPITATVEQAEPVYGTTVQGCTPRIDTVQEKVIAQEQTTIDGVLQNDCSDTLTEFPIKKDYAICGDSIDLEGRKATAQFRDYFIGTSLSVSYISETCVSDTDLVFDIVEDAASCGWATDTDTMMATKEVRLYYHNMTGQRVEALGSCQASTAIASVAMTHDASACDPRNADAETFERSQLTWMYQGERINSGICVESGVTWAHFEDGTSCDHVVNFDTNDVYPQSRTAYVNAANTTVHIDTACSPRPELAVALSTTNAGCEATFVDDFPAQVSHGTHKFYYEKDGGAVFATGCVRNDAVTYAHQQRTTGWQNDDTSLQALPRTETYINTSLGENLRLGGVILSGAVAVPYDLETVSELANEVSYTSCDRFTSTLETEVYRRPDNSTFNRAIGPGQTLGPINACATVLTQNWPKVRETGHQPVGGRQDCGGEIPAYDWGYEAWERGYYEGTRVVTREDGQLITDETVEREIYVSSGCTDHAYPHVPTHRLKPV